MTFFLTAIFSLTIGISAVLGLVKLPRIEKVYLPFILLLNAGFINEMISIYCAYHYRNNIVNYNIYLLAEILLITWQFSKWKLFQQRKSMYTYLYVFILSAWMIESFIISNLYSFNRYCLILFSLIIVILAIFQVAYMIFFETNKLLQYSKFIICVGFVIFYCAQIITESIGLYGLGLSEAFRVHLQTLFIWVNLFVNLIFIPAVIWIPTKPRYILQLQSA